MYLGIAGLAINYCHFILTVVFLCLTIYLYKKACSFEKDQAIITPEKEWLNKEIKQIRDQVDQIYKVKIKGSDENQEGEVQFKNTKIVAWLLNRS